MNNDPKNSDNNSQAIECKDPNERPCLRDAKGRLLKGSTPPKKINEGVLALRQLKNEVLTKISPIIIPTWIQLMSDPSPKVRLGAVKLAVETIFPKQVIQNITSKVFYELDDQGSSLPILLNSLPAFGEFLRWKSERDSARIVEVEVEPTNDQPSVDHRP